MSEELTFRDHALIHIPYEIEAVTLCRGNTLTVYLTNRERVDLAEETYSIQVELRITLDGKPEIFANDIEIIPFTQWESLSMINQKDKQSD